jgi:hypothetical protein
MIMAMKNIDETAAKTLQGDIQADPADNPGASPLMPVNATLFPTAGTAPALVVKSEEFELFLEAEVRGVKRRARAVLQHSASAPAAQSNRFRLVEWTEGWVEAWPEPPKPPT